MEGFLVVISGAAGTGKGSIISSVLEQNENLVYSVSMTTRAPRNGEVEGKSYHFVSKEHFEELIKQDQFVEYAFVHTDYYGTPKAKIEEEVKNGKIVLLEIDVQGAEIVLKKYPDAVSIFILPPSFEELERRLRNRGTETEEKILKRLKNAKEEMSRSKEYEYLVVNDDLSTAIRDVETILHSESLKTKRNLITI